LSGVSGPCVDAAGVGFAAEYNSIQVVRKLAVIVSRKDVLGRGKQLLDYSKPRRASVQPVEKLAPALFVKRPAEGGLPEAVKKLVIQKLLVG